MHTVNATIEIIGINPYILLAEKVLESIFIGAKKNKGPIPTKVIINGKPYIQNLIKIKEVWRLYINTKC